MTGFVTKDKNKGSSKVVVINSKTTDNKDKKRKTKDEIKKSFNKDVFNKTSDAEPPTPHSFNTSIEVSGDIPIIVIRKKALEKMYHYIDMSKLEVGWLGSVIREDNRYIIDDVFIFEQEVAGTTTEISPEGLMDFASELMKMENGMEIWNNIRLWGHSHVNMDTTPSGQDNSQMELFNDNGIEWFIRLIANKKGKFSFTLFVYDSGITFIDIPWVVENEIDDSLKEEVRKDMENKVSKKEYTYVNTKYNHFGYGNSGYVYNRNAGIYTANDIDTKEVSTVDEFEKEINKTLETHGLNNKK